MSGNIVSIIFEGFDKTSEAVKKVLKNFNDLVNGAGAFGQKGEEAGNKIARSIDEAAKSADNFKLKMSGLESLMAQGLGIAALYKLNTVLKESLDTFEMTSNSLRGLAAVSRYAGEDMNAATQAAVAFAQDGLVNIKDTSIALQNLLNRGFSLKESVDILNRLKDAAAFNRQSHLTMSQAINSATEGLKNENSILVDNAGVTKNVSVMWKEYAAQHSKGVDSLTQAEKRLAEYNGIMRETEGMLGNAKLAAEGLTGAKGRLANAVFNLKNALGEGLAPAFTSLADSVIPFVLNTFKAFIGGIEISAIKLAAWGEKINVVMAWVKSGFKGGISGLRAELKVWDDESEKMIDGIVKRWEGAVTTPDVGKDSGKRRQDVVLPDEHKAKAREWLKDRINKATLDELNYSISKANAEYAEKAKILGKTKELREAHLLEIQKLVADHDKKLTKEEEHKAEKLAGAQRWLADKINEATLDELNYKISKAKAEYDEKTKILGNTVELHDAFLQTVRKLVADHDEKISKDQKKKTEEEAKARAHALGEIKGFSQEYHLFREKQLEELAKKMRESGVAETDIARWKTEELKKVDTEYWQSRLDNSDSVMVTIEAKFTLMALNMKSISKQVADAIESVFTHLGTTLSDIFFDGMMGDMKKLDVYLKSFLKSMTRVLADFYAEWLMNQMKLQVLNLGKWIGGGTPGAPLADKIGPTNSSGVFHAGGLVMHTGGLVPRFHVGGLAADEVPAILQKGEYVVSKKGVAALDAINQGNVSGQDSGGTGNGDTYIVHINAIDPQSFNEYVAKYGAAAIVKVVGDNLRGAGALRDAVKSYA